MATTSERRPLRGRTVLRPGQRGAQVLITGREPGPGEDAAAAIRRQSGHELVRFLQADHATVGGNQQLADQVRAVCSRLDVLVNNVGGLYPTAGRSPTATRPPWP